MLTQSLLLSATQNESIQIASSVFIVIMLVLGLIAGRKHRNMPVARYAIYWFLILMVLVFVYSFKDDYSNIKHRFISALMPSTVIEENGVITVKRSYNGHFMINTYINGTPTVLLVDTGATSVVLSQAVAKKAGVDVTKLSFYREVITASGVVRVGEASVDIRIGNFEAKDFPVLINSSGIDESLMGMNLLNEFKSFSIQGDTMHLVY